MPEVSRPRFLVVGAGSRGRHYSRVLFDSGRADIVAVAEPHPTKRRFFVETFILPQMQNTTTEPKGPVEEEKRSDGSPPAWDSSPHSFSTWKDFVAWEAERKRTALLDYAPSVDAVFICTLDHMHRQAIEDLAPLGIHIMCEKPLACTLDDCLAIQAALQPPAETPTPTKTQTGAQSLLSPSSPSPAKVQSPTIPRAPVLFSIGHVLRYTPHNVLLRRLLVDEQAIGDVLTVQHTEPIGWWHYSHSYVRGNWRRQYTSGPSLLTKSCHDIDFLLWLLAYPATPHTPQQHPLDSLEVSDSPKYPNNSNNSNNSENSHGQYETHHPSYISSSGQLSYFQPRQKPVAAGAATNCLSCPLQDEGCHFSAKRLYMGQEIRGLGSGNTGWPVNVVVPDIEELGHATHGHDPLNSNGDRGGNGGNRLFGTREQHEALRAALARDYDSSVPDEDVAQENWFGRCVYECDNDVCDNQVVHFSWDEQRRRPPQPTEAGHHSNSTPTSGTRDGTSTSAKHDTASTLTSCRPNQSAWIPAKTATFHMVANTQKLCARYTAIYGSEGEIQADFHTITIRNYRTGRVDTYTPTVTEDGHGGGDAGLALAFLGAIEYVFQVTGSYLAPAVDSATDKARTAHDQAVREAQARFIGCTLEDCIQSHATVFAAEEARHSRQELHWPTWWARTQQEYVERHRHTVQQ